MTPKLFTYTAYRLPNKEDLIDIDNYKLTSDEIIKGFGYTIVGRGKLGDEQKKDIIKSIQMLVDMFPTNKEYKKALKKVKLKYNLKESKMALPIKNTKPQDPNNLSLKELIAADLPAPIQTEAKKDGFIALPSSSCQAAKYDEATETLYIRFNTGVYEYYDVPEKVFEMMLEAKSIGSFFYYNIRKVYNYALSKKYKTKGTKRTVKESVNKTSYNVTESKATLLSKLVEVIETPEVLKNVLVTLENEFSIELNLPLTNKLSTSLIKNVIDKSNWDAIEDDEWEEIFNRIDEVVVDSQGQEDDEEYKYEQIIIGLGQMIDEQVYHLYMNYNGDKTKLYPLIDAVQGLVEEEGDDELAIEASPEFETLCTAMNENNTLTEATESMAEPDITDEQEIFYFTSSSKDILGVKGLEHPRAQGLAVEILAKFREEFQSALDAADISQYFIMTLEFKDKEQMPNAELQEEELNDDNPLN